MSTAMTQPKPPPGTDGSAGVPRGYKRTEGGVIPEEWRVLPLRACLRNSPGYGINAAAVAFDDSLPTYLRITDIGDDSRFIPSPRVSVKHPNSAAFFLGEGDLVFARTGASVGKSYLYDPNDGPLVFAGFLICISPDPAALEPAFLAYYVQSKRYWDWVATMSIRSGQPGINGQEYGTLQLPLPATEEQRAIARALSDVDELIGALEKLIAKKQAIKLAAVQQLLTGKTRLPGFETKPGYKRTEVGVIPEDWGVKRLGELFEITSSKRVFQSEWKTEGIPFYRARELAVLGEQRYVKNELFISKEMYDTYKNIYGVPKCGDMLVTGVGTLGKVYVISDDHEFYFKDGNIIWFKSLGKVSPDFLGQLYLTQLVKKQIEDASAGTTVGTYTISGAKKTTIPVPPLPEQRAIAAVLSDMDAEIAALERRRDKVKQIKQGMMQELLTGRIRLVTPEQKAKA